MDASASGADEVGRAFSKTASVASSAGIEYKKLAAYIAEVSSVTRNSAETVGNSFKSLLSRYQQIRETGFNSEDSSDINMVTRALKTVGIQAVDSAGQLRSYDKVLDELAPKWDKLDKTTKAYLQTTLGGRILLPRHTAMCA